MQSPASRAGAGQAARGLGETTLLLRCGGLGDQAGPREARKVCPLSCLITYTSLWAPTFWAARSASLPPEGPLDFRLGSFLPQLPPPPDNPPFPLLLGSSFPPPPRPSVFPFLFPATEVKEARLAPSLLRAGEGRGLSYPRRYID